MQFRQVIAILIVLAVCLVARIVVRTGPGLRAKNKFEARVIALPDSRRGGTVH